VQKGMVKEERLKELVKPMYYTRMRLGEFDPPDNNPYVNITTAVIQSPAHREIAIQAAVESFVLLKNDGAILPFKGTVKKLAVRKHITM